MRLAVTPERIEAEYRRLGYQIGWRFMTCPARQFDDPEVLLVSLNPSGRVEHGPSWSQEGGSAYVDESWDGQAVGKDTLQIQIQRLVAHLGVSFDKVASAHFVPFRSERWADLMRSSEAVAFSKTLWADFISGMTPKYVVCLGTKVGEYIPALFGVKRMVKKMTGWGNITLSVGETSYGGQIIVLPHLGTFKLFSRAECAPYLKSAIGPGIFANA
ncbi:hypothetical protein [Novosphingobium sp.]|uniref:hypothetical protein n=1 Tax=Novosphingobium sp. TaxID=1874826 RepID=UPI0026375577|nr:hypothetical protein [Novosphingobium sp.]